jgi:hypothetical protein
MLTYDSGLQSALAAAVSKVDWCNTLLTQLGSALTIRCKRSADASSTTVFDTGTEFFSASISSALGMSGGQIAKFGNIQNATIRMAQDLSSGASVLRIEGNGHWIQGTLGLSNSSADFKVTQSPTAKTGMAFGTISISAPRSMPSGTGPVAPSLDANAPWSIVFEDWSIPSTPKVVKTINLDTRADDYVYQDSELAAEIGDVRMTQSSQTIVYGQFEFGVTMLSVHGGLNLENPGTPVHQIIISHKPYGTWASYPFSDTFRVDRDTTFPKPYKIKVLKADGTILKTFEMRDGLAINDPSLSQGWGPGYPLPMRPHFQCGQWHFWQSAKLKYSSNALKYFPGVTDHFMRDSIAKAGASTNGNIPLAYGGQWNSTLQWHGLPQWPTEYYTDGNPHAGETYDDPYLYDVKTYHGYEGHHGGITGWDIEPGSISGHDWYIGPGGPRADRGALHTPFVRYFSRPNGSRLKGNVPNRTMLDAYNHGYFHHSHHMFTVDVQKLLMPPKEWMRDGTISFGFAYYGSNNTYSAGGLPRTVALKTLPNQSNWPAPVRDGHKGFFHGWEVDQHHSYVAPGLATIFCNSPAHTISGFMRLYAHVCGQLGDAYPTSCMPGLFLSRVHAWRTWQLVIAWKTATTHASGIDRETIERRLQVELETVYDQVYVPAMVNNSTDPTMIGIRTFGQPVSVQYGTSVDGWQGYKWYRGLSDSKSGYFAAVLAVMRQTGCMAAMRARSSKCDIAIRFIIDRMDQDSLLSLYYTKGRYESNFVYSNRIASQGSATADTAASLPDPTMYSGWPEWVTNNPQNGQETLMTDVNGNITCANLDAVTTARFQWAFVRRDFFSDIPAPMDNGTNIVTSTCNMVQGWMDTLDTKVKGIAAPYSQSGADMQYAWPQLGIIKAPATLTPI